MSKLVRFDWAIKYLLRNKANFDILEGFLSELLRTPIRIEQILESESNKNYAEDKFNRVDLLVQTENGERIIIEVQCSSQWDYLSRVLYGASKVVCEYLREGDPYRTIKKVISVSIVFFDLGTGKDYLYKGTTSFKGLHYHDILGLNPQEQEAYAQGNKEKEQTPETVFPEYYLIKVVKFQERVKDKVDEWVYFLKHGEIKPEFKAQGIQSAAKKLDLLHLSEEERRTYERYRESLHDDGSLKMMFEVSEAMGRKEGEEIGLKKGEEIGLKKGEEVGLKKGEEIGLKKGELNAKQSLAQKLQAKGFSLNEIAALTELPIEKIKQLLNE